MRPGVGLVCNNFRIIRVFKGHPGEPLYNGATAVHGAEKEHIGAGAYLVRSAVAYRVYCCANFVVTPGTTFPKRVWEEAGGFDETLRSCEDYDFFIRVLASHDVVYIDEPLVTVVQHDTNTFSYADAARRSTPEHVLNLLRVLCREWARSNSEDIRTVLTKTIQNRLLDLAYCHRERGRYFRSAATYLDYMRRGGSLGAGLRSMAKLPAHWLLRAFHGSRIAVD
jgi:hypothetical protein